MDNDYMSDKKTMDPKSDCASLKTDKTSITLSHNNKTTSHSTNINQKDDLRNILMEVMKKIFSAKVVLTRLPNTVKKEIEPTTIPNTRNRDKIIFEKKSTRNKNKKPFAVKETAFINDGTTYVRKCPKCDMPPVVRKTQHCHGCKVDLIYECQKCRKQFIDYKKVLAHIDSKCFIKGYYHCPVCDFKTVAPVRVKSHMRLHPSVKYNKETLKWTDAKMISMHKCSQCSKEFDNHEFLNKHIQLCSRAQQIIKLVNSSSEQLRLNKDFQKMIIKFCPKCKEDTKVYDGGVSSLQPCKECGSVMKFKCSQCSKVYETYTGCQRHTRFGCNFLKKRNWHPRDGSGHTIYCPHCNHQFVQKLLKKHLLKCKVLHCKPRKSFTHKHLEASCENCDAVQKITDRHKICAQCKSGLHFRCKTCNQNFTAGNWCQHLKAHFDCVKYKCNNCGIGLISRTEFLGHLINCKRETFRCDLCNFTSKFKKSICKHILFMHPVFE